MKLVLFSVFITLSSVLAIELEKESADIIIDQSTNDGEVNLSVSESVGEEVNSGDQEDGRSIDETIYAHHENQHKVFEKKAKPLRNIFLGIYKNYKSTYLGNRTSSQYRELLKDRHAVATTTTEETPTTVESSQKLRKKKKKRRKNKKKRAGATSGEDPLIYSHDEEYRYNFGTGVNMSLDMKNDLVSLNLNEECLKDILLGRWNEPAVEGRGKKYEMVSKILPLFIIPFLIQSAIIPFLVTKLKLLLIKSILVGKLAIFLLVISALKNNSKNAPTYEVAPSYWAGEPSRRSEAYNGYRVEGRPSTLIN
ncbi:uncharacterized protein LOC129913706 [Episyrphus balteatus]|uniref:uncharacterized protein LOC129913706 n=1 Tax=Episyrphus balteatus TaxID=286459 RepID=UPI002485C3B6|nr:uncharacterized protein LOC129913706 [Episyrphus balteatus]